MAESNRMKAIPSELHEPIVEQACTFGQNGTLVGVYTPPVARIESKPCAIFITAGLLHHIGPSRLHVQLSRELSAQNVAGLRFDLSGVGDSETSSLGGYFVDRSVSEIQQAMDYLEKNFGHTHFVLLGLCSGADDSLATAQADPRVCGVVLLNGYAYKAGYFLINRFVKFYAPRLLNLQKLKNRFRSIGSKLAGTNDADAKALAALDDDYRHIPDRLETEQALFKLTEAKTNLLFIYTGSEHDDYTYEGQFFAMFPKLRGSEHVREHYLKQADHTLILQADRDVISSWVVNWFEQSPFVRRADAGPSSKA